MGGWMKKRVYVNGWVGGILFLYLGGTFDVAHVAVRPDAGGNGGAVVGAQGEVTAGLGGSGWVGGWLRRWRRTRRAE